MQKKWIILSSVPNTEPAWWADNESGKRTPVVHDSEMDAVLECLDDFIERLTDQREEVANWHREISEIDWETDMFVSECVLHDDGKITSDTFGVLFDPSSDDIPDDMFSSPGTK